MAAVHGPSIARHPTSFDKVKIAPSARPPTSASAQKPASSSDPYYGHEATAKLCARFVSHLFACPDYAPSSAAAPATPSPPLAVFIAYALHRTRLHRSVTFAALYLLQRLKQRFPAARGSSGHRLFLSAFMIASKVICDDTYSNKSWCIVGQGMFALREVNQMEREMCSYLDWELNVEPDALRRFEAEVGKSFAGPGPYPGVVLPPVPSKPVFAHPGEQATITVAPPSAWTKPAHSVSKPITVSPPRTHAYLVTPPTTPDTPAASHSSTTSPASSASPQTPPSYHTIEEAHAKISSAAAPAPYEPPAPAPSLKAQAMVRAMTAHDPAPAHEHAKPRGRTFMMPSACGPAAPYAFASPAVW